MSRAENHVAQKPPASWLFAEAGLEQPDPSEPHKVLGLPRVSRRYIQGHFLTEVTVELGQTKRSQPGRGLQKGTKAEGQTNKGGQTLWNTGFVPFQGFFYCLASYDASYLVFPTLSSPGGYYNPLWHLRPGMLCG